MLQIILVMLRRFGREALSIAQEAHDEATELQAFRLLQQLDNGEAKGEIKDIPEDHPVVKSLFELVEVRLKVGEKSVVKIKRGGRRKKSEQVVPEIAGGNNESASEPIGGYQGYDEVR